MRLLQQFELLERMHHLIKLQATGSPKDFAQKLKISESTLFEYLQTLKEMGGKIAYSRCMQSYYYETLVEFQIDFTSLESIQIKGGVSYFSPLRKNRSKLFYNCNALK